MHHMTVKTEHHGDVEINHNSDWSGIVYISWQETTTMKFNPQGVRPSDPYLVQRRQVELPGELLLALGKAAAKQSLGAAVIRMVEGWG